MSWSPTGATVASVQAVDTTSDLEPRLEGYRRELSGYVARVLRSPVEVEDAVQETMMRAWRGLDRFEQRAPLRAWLYRIATNVCFDVVRRRQRHPAPIGLGLATSEIAAGLPSAGPELPSTVTLAGAAAATVTATAAATDPAEVAASREAVRLAFVVALRHLPPRQRAVLILRDVLRWQGPEVAELLGTTVASVNSALQRARATLAAVEGPAMDPVDRGQRRLLARYVDAFERCDVDMLVALLHEDATPGPRPRHDGGDHEPGSGCCRRRSAAAESAVPSDPARIDALVAHSSAK